MKRKIVTLAIASAVVATTGFGIVSNAASNTSEEVNVVSPKASAEAADNTDIKVVEPAPAATTEEAATDEAAATDATTTENNTDAKEATSENKASDASTTTTNDSKKEKADEETTSVASTENEAKSTNLAGEINYKGVALSVKSAQEIVNVLDSKATRDDRDPSSTAEIEGYNPTFYYYDYSVDGKRDLWLTYVDDPKISSEVSVYDYMVFGSSIDMANGIKGGDSVERVKELSGGKLVNSKEYSDTSTALEYKYDKDNVTIYYNFENDKLTSIQVVNDKFGKRYCPD